MMMNQREVMPFIRFEYKDWGLNVDASKEAGRPIPNRSAFIIITSHGSKDSPEFIADEWIQRKKNEAARGVYNGDWIERIEKQYEAWKKGNELPREGTPVLTWPAITPEQNARLRHLGFTVIEDVAQVPDGSLGQIGLDGRQIRDLARAWINEGTDKGKNAQLIADQNSRIEAQDTLIREMQEELKALRAQSEKRGPGRPPKVEAA